MRRILILSGAVLLAPFALAAGALGLAQTEPGRAFLAARLEAIIAGATGGEADIGALGAGLPGDIILRDVTLSENAEPWARLGEARVKWRPFSALAGKPIIEMVAVSDLTLHRAPPQKPQTDEGEQAPSGVSFPDLPDDLQIQHVQLERITLEPALTGAEQIRLDGGGALIIIDGAIETWVNLESDDGRDRLHGEAVLDPGADFAEIDFYAHSAPDGALARLADLGGPISLSAKGAAPASDFAFPVTAEIGAVAAIDGRLGYIEAAKDAIAFDGEIILGERLSEAAATLGDRARLKAVLREGDNGGAALTLEELSADIGALTGALSWRNRGERLAALTAELVATPAPERFPVFDDYIGPSLSVTMDLSRAGREGYDLTLEAFGERLALALAGARTDLRGTLKGAVAAEFTPSETSPELLKDGASLTLALDADSAGAIRIDDLSLLLGANPALSGGGAYDLIREQMTANAALSLPAATLNRLAPDFAPDGPLYLKIDAQGALDQITAALEADLPGLTLNGDVLEPMTATAAFSGLPARPSGTLTLGNADGSRRLDADLRSAETGAITLSKLDYQTPLAALRGKGFIDPVAQSLKLDLDFKGEPGARPIPGVALAGDLALNADLKRDSDANTLSLISQTLAGDSFSLRGVSAALEGPSDALAVTLNAGRIDVGENDPITDFSAQAVAQWREAVFIALTGLEAKVGDLPLRARETASLSFEDGAEIKNLKLTLGETGVFALDGAATADRLQARARLADFPAPVIAATLNAAIDLDTDLSSDRPTGLLASGEASLIPEISADGAGAIKALVEWRDDRLTIKSPEDAKAEKLAPLTIDLALPLRLLRNDGWRVETQGNPRGVIGYDGRAETLAAFLPGPAQGLEGALKLDLTLNDAGLPLGTAALTDGAYTDIATGFNLTDITLDATLAEQDGAPHLQFNGGAGPAASAQSAAPIRYDGALSLDETPSATVKVALDKARFAADPVSRLIMSGTLDIDGPLDDLGATGALNIDGLDVEIVTPEASGLVDIDVIALKGANGADAERSDAARKAPITLDIAITANDKIFVRGRGLESEWSADLRALTDKADMLAVGAVSLRRGALDFAGRRFELTDGEIILDRLSPNNPVLDMRAEYKTSDDVTAAIVVSGRAQSPTIELQSTPSLPREDVMALILFGKPANQLTATQSLQMAQALAQLGGIGPFAGGGGLTGSARQALGLDMLNVDFDNNTGDSSLTVGKYVADGLFVSASQDVKGENGAVRVEYEVTGNVTVETELQQNGDQTVSANWKLDF